MGLSNSFMSLGRIFSLLWAGTIYDVNLSMPYLSGSLFMFVGFIASLIWITDETQEARHELPAH
jgi:DHA1 family multidrug resistance protein-like MFS transporter